MLFLLKDSPFSKKSGAIIPIRTASRKGEIPGMDLNPLTLSFQGKQANLETLFHASYAQQYLRHGRICLVLATLINLIYCFADYFAFPEFIKELWIIRFGIITPMFLGGLVYSFRPGYFKYWQPLFTLYFLVAGITHTFVIWLEQSPDIHLYYVGIVVVLIFGYTFIRLRFIPAVISGWIIVGAYMFIAAFVSRPAPMMLIYNSVFLFSVNFIGSIICYTSEIDARRNFFLSWLLEQEQEKVTTINQRLEKRVAERTAELSLANQELEKEFEAHRKAISDKQMLEKQLRQAQKMEAIGTLAGGIAHDFNNILSAIIGFTELTIEDVKDDEFLTDNMNEVLIASERARGLIQQILTFSRQTEKELRPIALTLVAKEIVKLLRATLPTTIDIRQNFTSDRLILGDTTQIHQLIMNLCTNASHAMQKRGGILQLTICDLPLEASNISLLPELQPGNYLKLIISDTGHGIPEQNLERIFDPFYTTKKNGEGTGLGLSVVHGIVQSLKGAIRVESREGKGTTFEIYFPTVERPRDKAPAHDDEPMGGTEHILLVDDEPSLLKAGSRMLERLGYRITPCNSSPDALKLFRKAPERFDLVISDLTMPHLTGEAFAAEIKRLKPEIPIIVCTGFGAAITVDTAIESGISAIVNKPIIKRNIARTVRQALDGTLPSLQKPTL